MKIEAQIVLIEIVSTTTIAILIMGARLVWLLYRNKQWKKSLKKEELIGLEHELTQCLRSNGLTPGTTVRIEDIIRGQGYTIREQPILLFQQAYTTQQPEKSVYIWKFLLKERRRFALAHELMHIIYRPEELSEGRKNRNTHFFLKKRDPSEQKRDYMAASLLLPCEQFWNELVDADYFNLESRDRTAFVYKLARKYDVETSTIFRRISEMNVIMR